MTPDPTSESPEWQQIKAQFPVGARVRGTVMRHRPYAFIVDLGGATGLVLIADLRVEGQNKAAPYPPIGSAVEAVVIRHVECAQFISLSMRPSWLRDAK